MRQKIQRSVIAALMIMLIPSISIAQSNEELTPYESAREDLAVSTMEKITKLFNPFQQVAITSHLSSKKEELVDRFDYTILLDDYICKLCGISVYLDETSKNNYALLSSMSFSDQAAINSLANIGKDYSNKRELIEKGKTAIDNEREVIRKQKRYGYGKLINKVRKEFASWAKRGEFETRNDYSKRMDSLSVYVFDSICFSTAKDLICNYKIVDRKYDIDNERVVFKLNFYDVDGSLLVAKEGYLKINPEAAKNYMDFSVLYAKNIYKYNGYLLPTSIVMHEMEDRTYEQSIYIVDIQDNEAFTIQGNIINDPVTTKDLQSHVFNYQEYTNNLFTRADLYNSADSILESFCGFIQTVFGIDTIDCHRFDYPWMLSNKGTYTIDSYLFEKEFDNCIAEYKKILLDKGFYEYGVYSRIGFSCFGELLENYNYLSYINSLRDCMYSLDTDSTLSLLSRVERELVISAANKLTKEYIGNLGYDHLYKYLFEEYKWHKFFNPVEDLCRLAIENNEYLKKKIKIKDGYESSLSKFYTKIRHY